MDKRLLSRASLIAMSVLLVLAMSYPLKKNWPDYVHVKYGFPLTWGIHTISTIQGAVDIWEVNISSLVINLLIWMGLTVLFQVIIQLRTEPQPA